jgi:hypothetical protein
MTEDVKTVDDLPPAQWNERFWTYFHVKGELVERTVREMTYGEMGVAIDHQLWAVSAACRELDGLLFGPHYPDSDARELLETATAAVQHIAEQLGKAARLLRLVGERCCGGPLTDPPPSAVSAKVIRSI